LGRRGFTTGVKIPRVKEFVRKGGRGRRLSVQTKECISRRESQ